jgi:hypothetical protein
LAVSGPSAAAGRSSEPLELQQREQPRKSPNGRTKGPKGRRTDRVRQRPPGVLCPVRPSPADGGAARLSGCGLAGVLVLSELLMAVPTVRCTHKRTTNTRCGYRSGESPGVFCPGLLLITASCRAEGFSASTFGSSSSFGACSATALSRRKPIVPLFHLAE